MGLHFGILFHGMRGIITFRLSPMELSPFKGTSKSISNTVRRCRESAPYTLPSNIVLLTVLSLYLYKMYESIMTNSFLVFIVGYMIMAYGDAKHKELGRKNPADFENDE